MQCVTEGAASGFRNLITLEERKQFQSHNDDY